MTKKKTSRVVKDKNPVEKVKTPIRFAGSGSAEYIKVKGSSGLFWYIGDEGKIGVLDCTKTSIPKETIFDNKEEFIKYVVSKELIICT